MQLNPWSSPRKSATINTPRFRTYKGRPSECELCTFIVQDIDFHTSTLQAFSHRRGQWDAGSYEISTARHNVASYQKVCQDALSIVILQ